MATRALSADAGRASSEIPEDISAPSRRRLMGLAGIGAIALATPAMIAAAPKWNAGDWVDRWHQEGCGLKVGGNALHLKARLNGNREAIGLLIAEVSPADRQTAVIRFIEAHDAMLNSIGLSVPVSIVWDKKLLAYETAAANYRAAWAAYVAAPTGSMKEAGLSPLVDKTQELVEHAETALWDMPAPDLRALLWKLELLLADDGNGETSGWSLAFVKPALEDARRLLGAHS